MLFFEIYMFKFLERKQEKVVFIRVPTVPPPKKRMCHFSTWGFIFQRDLLVFIGVLSVVLCGN